MRTEDYKAMLEAVDRALKICHESLGRMDVAHRKICDDLKDAHDRLRALLQLPPA